MAIGRVTGTIIDNALVGIRFNCYRIRTPVPANSAFPLLRQPLFCKLPMMKHRSPLQWLRVTLLLAYWCLLFIGTHLPGRVVPSGLGSDKFLHFTAFAGLSFLLAWVIAPLRPTLRAMGLTLLIAIGYAALDEWTQSFVPHRHSDVRDWIADGVGALIGLCAYMVTWVFANGVLTSWYRGPRNSATRETPCLPVRDSGTLR